MWGLKSLLTCHQSDRDPSQSSWVTVTAAKGLSVVEGARCSQCKSFSAFIFSEAFCVPRTGSSQSGLLEAGQWGVGLLGAGVASLTLYVTLLVTGPCQGTRLACTGGPGLWLAPAALVCQHFCGRCPCWKLELRAGGGGSF